MNMELASLLQRSLHCLFQAGVSRALNVQAVRFLPELTPCSITARCSLSISQPFSRVPTSQCFHPFANLPWRNLPEPCKVQIQRQQLDAVEDDTDEAGEDL